MENKWEGGILNFGFLILNVWNSAGGFCWIWCLWQGRWSGEVAISEEPESRRVLQRQQLAKSAIGGVHICRGTGLSCHGVGEAEDGSPENISIGGTKVPRSE